ncbi:MAG: serine/threonine protein kinase [Gemmatimonadetes bacterium]|nr:serine/threonine protein kinase [Gemmatimonadota bacterium]
MAHENLAGRSIAGYRLLERVGEGGTATVYRADHDTHGRCAVKTLRERLRNDPTAVKRFLREAGYGSRVRHPNVVRTYDYGDTDGLYYLALEWADGQPLADYVARHGRLPAPEVAQIVEQLAGALAAAHAVGIIHRDLKPENIIYDAPSRAVKLLDFGIARDAQEDPAERLTRTGFFVGTLQYVAPEALSGELVGEAADIYSLATITYYLLTGVHPYTGRSPRQLFQKLLTEPPVRLNTTVKGLQFSRTLEDAVMKGLAREAANRQASVLEFAADVRRGVAGESPAPPKRGVLGLLGSIMGRRS